MIYDVIPLCIWAAVIITVEFLETVRTEKKKRTRKTKEENALGIPP